MIRPSQLAELLEPRLTQPPPLQSDAPFSDIVIDSREATAGSLFVALKGEHTDGHRYVAHAAQRGAAAVLISDPAVAPPDVTAFIVDDPLSAMQDAAREWRQRQDALIVGITGSVGKTTVREATAQLLSGLGGTYQSPKNYNGDIGLPIAILGIDASHRFAVIEIGPYSEDEMRLLTTTARPDVGIVTNVGPTHLERFGRLDDTERIKGMLPAIVPAGGLAVLNGDDPRVRRMARRTEADVVTFGFGGDADLRASDVVAHGFDGVSFQLERGGRRVEVRTPLIGAHQAMTALAAGAAAMHAGMTLAQLGEALAELRPGSRLRRRRAANGATMIDDAYNAAPLSMRAALELLDGTPRGRGRRIAVLGDMLELGTESETAHGEIGEFAAKRCDVLICVGERAERIAAAAREAGAVDVRWTTDRQVAADVLERNIREDDTVLIKASHGVHLETLVERLSV